MATAMALQCTYLFVNRDVSLAHTLSNKRDNILLSARPTWICMVSRQPLVRTRARLACRNHAYDMQTAATRQFVDFYMNNTPLRGV